MWLVFFRPLHALLPLRHMLLPPKHLLYCSEPTQMSRSLWGLPWLPHLLTSFHMSYHPVTAPATCNNYLCNNYPSPQKSFLKDAMDWMFVFPQIPGEILMPNVRVFRGGASGKWGGHTKQSPRERDERPWKGLWWALLFPAQEGEGTMCKQEDIRSPDTDPAGTQRLNLPEPEL